MGMQVVLAI